MLLVNTIKGFIVISGYADDLNGVTFSTWEKMTPYTSAEEALAAGWTYDPTATSALRWKVTLQKESETSVSAAIALGQEGGKDAIVFENTYSKFVVPSLPPTGDTSTPALYLLLAAASLFGILLVRRKRIR